MSSINSNSLPWEILDIIPNPVLVKNDQLEYVWVNRAFAELFNIRGEELKGRLDKEIFPDRQVAQCNGGDLRVLESGEMDESYESVYRGDGQQRETITRKSRLELADGRVFLVGVMHDVTEITHANERLQASQTLLEDQAIKLAELAQTDELTGCGNRRKFRANCEPIFESTEVEAALLMFDLDRFKHLNDTHGHDVGDAALKHFSSIVKQMIPDEDLFFRIGGEEFAVVLTNVSVQVAEETANRMREAVAETSFLIAGKTLSISTSVGVEFKAQSASLSLDKVLSRADTALYTAKADGKNCVRIAA